jgi:hypothetical protein
LHFFVNLPLDIGYDTARKGDGFEILEDSEQRLALTKNKSQHHNRLGQYCYEASHCLERFGG